MLHKPLTNDDLPLCKVDHPLPKVPSKKDTMKLILETNNIKHKAELAVAYGAALRISEVATLRFRDISFTDNTITISQEASKNRHAGTVELPARLKRILRLYWEGCRRGAKPDDWLFPGQRIGSHISSASLRLVFNHRLQELGWESRGYTFHSLRHAHALHYYQAGADLFQVQQRLRHRSIASTLIYVQLDARLQERRHIENPFDDAAYAEK